QGLRESRAQEVEQEELVEDLHAAQGGLNGLVDEVKGGEPSSPSQVHIRPSRFSTSREMMSRTAT
ncbi:MAG: hypothetical protein ACLQLE_14820, partial [Desulfobaccales bacterium]